MVMVAEVLDNIARHKDFVLTSHARPDGDAVGSTLACYQILKSLGKNADVVLSDGVPFLYRPLPYADRVVKTNSINGGYQAAIILECDSLQRTRVRGLERHFLINIDHHVSGRPFAHINWIDPSACATAELIYELAREAGVKITSDIATCLYTAVLTDTGAFCFSGTNERTFALAQELVRCGAEPSRVAQNVYFSNPASKMRLLGAALSNLQREGKLAWMWISREDMQRCQAVEEDCEGLVNYALSVSGVEVTAFFRELPDGRYRVSLRSKGAVNVSNIAAGFNGGGHECASGCSVLVTVTAATESILPELRSALAGIT